MLSLERVFRGIACELPFPRISLLPKHGQSVKNDALIEVSERYIYKNRLWADWRDMRTARRTLWVLKG